MGVDAHFGSALSQAVAPAGRILLVDDEEAVMLTIQGVLELDGYQVTATASAQQALELLQTEHFEILVTDLRLEGASGLDLLRQQRLVAPDTVAIVLTGYASLDSALTAMRQGAYDYLLKPCEVIELRTTVTRALERGRKAAELRAHVRQLESANDEFMATVSHDLKSPLTFIKGMAGLRRRRAPEIPGTEPLLDALDQIQVAAGRMAQQLDEFVDATRLRAGRPLELLRRPTDLVRLAQRVADEHQQISNRHVVQVTHTLPSVTGNWDEQRLGRVLDKLLANARKNSPRGGAIEVSVDVEADHAVLTVRDRGDGSLPASLAEMPAIVEQHGGSVAVDSEAGRGSTVTVRLPLKIAPG